MKKRFTSRGYSILAALVFVAVLGTITVAVNLVSPSANPLAMSALAPNPTAAQVKQAPLTIDPEVQAKCKEAIQKAKSNAGKSPQLTQPFKGDTHEKNKCVAAVLDQAAVTRLTGQGVPREQAILRDDAYKCVGETTKVYMSKKGEGTITSTAKEGSEPGKCETTFCDESGVNCSVSKVKDGKTSILGWGTGDKETLKGMTPEQLEGLKNLGELSPAQQEQLKNAFAEQRQDTDVAIGKQEQNVKTAQEQLDGIARACGEAPGDASCAAVTRQAEERLKQEQQKLDELNKRMQALKNAEKATLQPPPVKLPANPPLPKPRPEQESTFPGGGGPGGGAGGGNPMSALGSLLQGLMKGLGGGAPQGAPCASDPTAYQQQQQQYQMQMQQYNYQLQQYNYQQQQASYYGGVQPTPPVPPAACTPTADSNSCPTPPVQPSTGCPNGSWKPVTTQMSNGRQCTSNWQCTPTNAVTPTAELSCQPKVADVGMSIAISFSCANATGSTGAGGGFSTDNKTSGTTTVPIETPPAGATGITYALTCRNQNLTARAECSVQIAKPTIVLLANPKNVASGEMSNVGWVTSGMQSCVISSPQMPGFTTQNAGNKSVNGVATTSPITRDTTVVLTCQTIGGSTKAASTTIIVGNSTSSAAMSVSSTIDGRTDVKHGATTTITWQATSAPSNSAIALWLVDMLSGQATGLIHRTTNTSGTYAWALPATSTPCAIDSPAVCGADLVVGRSYSIQASLFTPPDAYLGGYPPANPITPTYLDDVSTIAFKISN